MFLLRCSWLKKISNKKEEPLSKAEKFNKIQVVLV